MSNSLEKIFCTCRNSQRTKTQNSLMRHSSYSTLCALSLQFYIANTCQYDWYTIYTQVHKYASLLVAFPACRIIPVVLGPYAMPPATDSSSSDFYVCVSFGYYK